MDALGCADHNPPPPPLLANKETRTTKLRGGGGGVACKVTDDIVGKSQGHCNRYDTEIACLLATK